LSFAVDQAQSTSVVCTAAVLLGHLRLRSITNAWVL